MKPVLLLVVACIALTACAGPRPEAPVNAQVTPSGSWREVTATPAPTDREWWRAFNDPVLDRLVETALAKNSDLAIAAARVAEARYGYQAAEGALLKGARDFNKAFKEGTDKAEIINILIKYTSVKDPQLYDKMQLSELSPNGSLDANNLQEQIDWLVKYNLVKTRVEATKLIDTTFTERAIQEIGRA